MTIEDLIVLFRKQVQDTSKPYLWDDVEVFQYLVSAQDDLVRVMGGISDMTTRSLTDLPVVVDVPFARFSPYILRIRSGRLVTEKRDIPIISEADLGQVVQSDYGLNIGTALDDEQTGPVTHAVIGLEDKKLRWVKVPATADTFRMHIYRLPFPRMTDTQSCLEIDEQHHIHLIMGMKAMAYRKEDAETYDKSLADDNKAAFQKYCEEARDEKDRQRFKPRVVQYGGI